MEPLACVVELVPGYKGGHPGTPVAAGARSRRLISGCMPEKREPKFQRRQQPQTQPLWYQMRMDAVSSKAILYQHPPPKNFSHSGRAARTGDGCIECRCNRVPLQQDRLLCTHAHTHRPLGWLRGMRVTVFCAMRLCRSSAGRVQVNCRLMSPNLGST